ncbi:MAG TPA: SPOR domain-containing protein [Smithella sp.]|nr:SPOR domain-containing protein [Smithella sp.]
MIKSIFNKSNWMVLLATGILFIVLTSSLAFAEYTGHVASFKSEKNAIVFVHKMKAKGLVAYYRKENVPGKGEFYRTYIGEYKTMPLAQKALTKLKKSGVIDYFHIQEKTEKSGEIATSKPKITAQASEPALNPEKKTETTEQTSESAQKSESKTEVSTQNNEPTQKTEEKTETVVPKTEPAQKPVSKTETPAQTNEPVQRPEKKTETTEQTSESAQKSESKTEVSAQNNEPTQKTEEKTETVVPKTEPAQKPVSKTETAAQTNEPVKKTESKTTSSVDTRHYYDSVKGIVLKDGRVIKGRIISIDENDVLKIRTRTGRILSFSFTKDVKEYITEP